MVATALDWIVFPVRLSNSFVGFSVATSEPSKSLADRVQSLRLPPSGRQASGGAALPWTLCLVLTGVVGYLLWAGNPLATPPESDEDSSPKPAAVVNPAPDGSATAGGTAAAGEIALEAKGYIIPEQQILVSPQVSGRIIELNFDAGQRVEKDFILAVLENTEYLAEYDRIRATLESSQQNLAELEEGNRPDEKAQARAELAEAETNLAQLSREFQRKKDLLERKIISREDYEATESQYQATAKKVERLAANSRLMDEGARTERKRMAKAQVQQIEAELRRAKWRLDNCVISAPIRGTILKKNAELGNLVNSVAFNGSFSLCDIADLSKLEVELSIQERDISRVFKGQKCRVRAEAYPKRVYDGVVSRLMPIADRAKGALPVRVRLSVPADEEGMYLKPEMGAIVTFYNAAESESPGEQPPTAISVPPQIDDRPSTNAASVPDSTAKDEHQD
ncbi:MAG: efflux RND transporter periplasmic adaptor subunit [Planctomycetes bacterium]|nr:efflux RND transporter periplasmic adaptor subunit [Planctomycetota bacterium]